MSGPQTIWTEFKGCWRVFEDQGARWADREEVASDRSTSSEASFTKS